jgi:hypothetical protein
VLIEADPAGGTLAAGSGWPAEPSLMSLAAAVRRGGEPALVWEHCYQLPGGAAVLAGPSSADHARSAVGMAAGLLGRLGELDADVLVDWIAQRARRWPVPDATAMPWCSTSGP